MDKETIFVSFSGGRTSAYMCHWLINNKSDEYDFIFVFANTGLEHEATLEFVNKCDKEFNLNLVWLEAKVNPEKGAKIEFNIVDYETASRNGEPFADICAKHGVPNSGRPFCTQYLKTYPINAYKASLGFKRNHKTAIGIRADEFDRMNYGQLERNEVTYPLIASTHTTKPDIIYWFRNNGFDLDMESIYGNCVGCFKKSDRHLMTIAKHNPQHFDFFRNMEELYGHIDAKENDPFRFYRGNKTADDIIKMSETPFREYSEEINEFPMSLDIEPIDEVGDCGGACEVA